MNTFGRQTVRSLSTRYYNKILCLFNENDVLFYLWNLKRNNGILNRRQFNIDINTGKISDYLVSELLITIDKIFRNQEVFEHLTMNVPEFNNAENNYFLDPRRPDPGIFIYYLFSEYY